MYVETVPNRNSPPAILLRETYRVGKINKKRTLANLSHWDRARIDALRAALRGEFDHIKNAPAEATPLESGPVFGVLYALKKVADDLGLPGVLGNSLMGKLSLFLVLSRIAHGGSRCSAVRWAKDHAVEEVLGLEAFDEEALYAALKSLAKRQEKIEKKLFENYVKRCGKAPGLFLYDVTSSYLEGEQNELGAFGHNRDGKKGKLQIVIGLLADEQGEPLAIRVFEGNTSDPTTVPTQIEILKKRFGVTEVTFVGDRGMVKSAGQKALNEVGFRYITSLTDPQVRKLLAEGTLQMSFFEEEVCEVVAGPLRYILRKNESEARREHHRLDDKLKTLQAKVQARNEKVAGSKRCDPQAGLADLQPWVDGHKLSTFVTLKLESRQIKLEIDEAKKNERMLLAGCYVLVTDVPKESLEAQKVHDRYLDLQKVERDFRFMKTGFLEVRPIFVRKDEQTRGHVFVCMLALKLSREIQARLTKPFGTTKSNSQTVTLADALAALGRLCLVTYSVDKNRRVTRLPKPDEHQQKILEALNVHLPTR